MGASGKSGGSSVGDKGEIKESTRISIKEGSDEEYLKVNEVLRKVTSIDRIDPYLWRDADKQTLEGTINSILDVYEKHGDMFSPMNNIVGVDSDAQAMFSYYEHHYESFLRMSTQSFVQLPPSAVNRVYQHDVDVGWHPKGTTWKDIMVHELGHSAAYRAFHENKGISWSTSATDFTNFEKEIVKDAYNSLPKDIRSSMTGNGKVIKTLGPETREQVCGSISRYATKDAGECIAEAFADYHANGNNAQPLSKAIYQQLKKRIK